MNIVHLKRITALTRRANIPHGICNVSMFRYSKQLVWPGYSMQVGAKPIVKVRVWLPNLFQHLDIQTELINAEFVMIFFQTGEAQTFISPVLSKVTIHRVVLYNNKRNVSIIRRDMEVWLKKK